MKVLFDDRKYYKSNSKFHLIREWTGAGVFFSIAVIEVIIY